MHASHRHFVSPHFQKRNQQQQLRAAKSEPAQESPPREPTPVKEASPKEEKENLEWKPNFKSAPQPSVGENQEYSEPQMYSNRYSNKKNNYNGNDDDDDIPSIPVLGCDTETPRSKKYSQDNHSREVKFEDDEIAEEPPAFLTQREQSPEGYAPTWNKPPKHSSQAKGQATNKQNDTSYNPTWTHNNKSQGKNSNPNNPSMRTRSNSPKGLRTRSQSPKGLPSKQSGASQSTSNSDQKKAPKWLASTPSSQKNSGKVSRDLKDEEIFIPTLDLSDNKSKTQPKRRRGVDFNNSSFVPSWAKVEEEEESVFETSQPRKKEADLGGGYMPTWGGERQKPSQQQNHTFGVMFGY